MNKNAVKAKDLDLSLVSCYLVFEEDGRPLLWLVPTAKGMDNNLHRAPGSLEVYFECQRMFDNGYARNHFDLIHPTRYRMKNYLEIDQERGYYDFADNMVEGRTKLRIWFEQDGKVMELAFSKKDEFLTTRSASYHTEGYYSTSGASYYKTSSTPPANLQ